MATFKICTFKHQQRADKTYPVSIRVTWKRKSAYVKTEYRVVKRQLTRNFEIKDSFILRELNNRIADYEELMVKKLGRKIEYYSAKDLADFFVKQTTNKGGEIDFVEFSRKHVSNLKSSYRHIFNATLNALIDFTGTERIFISEITSKFLVSFENYLKTERRIIRKDQFGRETKTKKPPSSDLTVRNYTSNIRTLFNAAIAEFNDEDKGDIVIMHYPFRKYKVKPLPVTRKRNLSVEEVRKIISVEDKVLTQRAIVARDVFLLSFMLVGMNTADLYDLPADAIKEGRITYRRVKTMDRRSDQAEISIKIEPEVQALINKYRGVEKAFSFSSLYSSKEIFNANVNKGLKVVAVAAVLKVPLSTYYARHSWASIARNDCRISKDDVHFALNHVDEKTKITDIYIARDWSIIDDANRKVLDLVF